MHVCVLLLKDMRRGPPNLLFHDSLISSYSSIFHPILGVDFFSCTHFIFRSFRIREMNYRVIYPLFLKDATVTEKSLPFCFMSFMALPAWRKSSLFAGLERSLTRQSERKDGWIRRIIFQGPYLAKAVGVLSFTVQLEWTRQKRNGCNC